MVTPDRHPDSAAGGHPDFIVLHHHMTHVHLSTKHSTGKSQTAHLTLQPEPSLCCIFEAHRCGHAHGPTVPGNCCTVPATYSPIFPDRNSHGLRQRVSLCARRLSGPGPAGSWALHTFDVTRRLQSAYPSNSPTSNAGCVFPTASSQPWLVTPFDGSHLVGVSGRVRRLDICSCAQCLFRPPLRPSDPGLCFRQLFLLRSLGAPVCLLLSSLLLPGSCVTKQFNVVKCIGLSL